MKKKYILFLLPLLLLGACSNNNEPVKSVELSIEERHIEVVESSTYSKENKTIVRDDNKKIKGELYIPDNNQEIYPFLVNVYALSLRLDIF